MSTLPVIIAIAAAAAVVVLVLVAVVMSRRRKAHAAADKPVGSFLGSRPQDTFAGLGEPETSAEPADDEFRLDWGHTGEGSAAAPPAAPDEEEPAGPDEEEPSRPDEEEPQRPTEDDAVAGATEEPPAPAEREAEAAATGEPAAAEHDAVADGVAAAQAPGEHDALADAEEAKAPEETPEEPPAPRMVPLSDIIVTTSRKMVDLADPEVRRMLTELVRYEIDQASEFSAAGQTVDAVLQLTEAEKVSRALGMDETAARIKTMMRDLRD